MASVLSPAHPSLSTLHPARWREKQTTQCTFSLVRPAARGTDDEAMLHSLLLFLPLWLLHVTRCRRSTGSGTLAPLPAIIYVQADLQWRLPPPQVQGTSHQARCPALAALHGALQAVSRVDVHYPHLSASFPGSSPFPISAKDRPESEELVVPPRRLVDPTRSGSKDVAVSVEATEEVLPTYDGRFALLGIGHGAFPRCITAASKRHGMCRGLHSPLSLPLPPR